MPNADENICKQIVNFCDFSARRKEFSKIKTQKVLLSRSDYDYTCNELIFFLNQITTKLVPQRQRGPDLLGVLGKGGAGPAVGRGHGVVPQVSRGRAVLLLLVALRRCEQADLDVLRNVVREKAVIPRVAPRVHLQLSDEGGNLRALAPSVDLL